MSYDRKSQTRIFVGGLGDNMPKDDLEREFSKYGKLSQVWVAQNPPGFAFLEFEDSQDADEAVRQMNGMVLNGSRLRVEHSRGGRGGRGGGRGGGGGGGSFYRGGRGGGGFDRGGSRGFRGGRGSGGSGGFRGGRGGGGGGGGGFDRSRRGGYDSYGGGRRDDGYEDSSYSSSGSNYGGGYNKGRYNYSESSSPRYRSRSPLGAQSGYN